MDQNTKDILEMVIVFAALYCFMRLFMRNM